MVLLKELSLAVFLLLTSAFQAWGQPACTSHLMPNSTVDVDQYNNTGLRVIQSLTSSGLTGMADCTLRCCETENCSLVIFTADRNNNCELIHCVSEEACKPIPSNTSRLIRSIKNNKTDLATTLASNYTSNAAENTSATNPADLTDRTTLNTPSAYTTNTATVLPANTSVFENTTDSSTDFGNSSINATNLGSADNNTSISSDNVTVENTTGLNASEAQILQSSNATSLNESLETSDNSTGGIPSNDTSVFAEPVTESLLLSQSSPGANMTSSLENGTISANMTSSLENGTISVSQNSTVVPAVVNGSNSTWMNSTNGTLPSFNGLDGNGSANNTVEEEAEGSDQSAPVADDQSMMVILVATLSVGMLLFIAIVAVVSKKAVDGWQRRHYSRIDYLVNGK